MGLVRASVRPNHHVAAAVVGERGPSPRRPLSRHAVPGRRGAKRCPLHIPAATAGVRVLATDQSPVMLGLLRARGRRASLDAETRPRDGHALEVRRPPNGAPPAPLPAAGSRVAATGVGDGQTQGQSDRNDRRAGRVSVGSATLRFAGAQQSEIRSSTPYSSSRAERRATCRGPAIAGTPDPWARGRSQAVQTSPINVGIGTK